MTYLLLVVCSRVFMRITWKLRKDIPEEEWYP
jgi:hypothetical protein